MTILPSPFQRVASPQHTARAAGALLSWIFAAIVISLPGTARSAETAARPTVESLAWLEGTWVFEKAGTVITETWIPPAGGTMLGVSRTVTDDRTSAYEFLIIIVRANGSIAYIARPSNQAETTFPLVRASDREVVFENPAHDFPQRILYQMQDDGRLLVSIEGRQSGKVRRIEMAYRKAPR